MVGLCFLKLADLLATSRLWPWYHRGDNLLILPYLALFQGISQTRVGKLFLGEKEGLFI
jgi:hypothetical protein